MRILFVHQNFPGQFKQLAPALVAGGHSVDAMTMRPDGPATDWQGVRLLRYSANRSSTIGVHPWLVDFETKAIRGEAAYGAAQAWREQGLQPDLIVAHPGWGESLFLKDVWPEAKLGIYSEFYYRPQGGDLGFDPEFAASDEAAGPRMRMKNINNMMHFEVADAGLAPTRWQADSFPEPFRSSITVVHDGVDTQLLAPNASAALTINGRMFTRSDEIVTFVNRNLEPQRGYHVFMRALPQLLRERPRARVLIVGGTGRGYGVQPPEGTCWRDVFLAEVRPQLRPEDLQRIFFLGTLPYAQFVSLLQLSTVHVYLTYPFVLSWSLLEAMSVGCAIVASNTAPVREVISDEETGRLVPFFDASALATSVAQLLDDETARRRLGARARELALAQYDLRSCCLPRQLEWIDRLAG